MLTKNNKANQKKSKNKQGNRSSQSQNGIAKPAFKKRPWYRQSIFIIALTLILGLLLAKFLSLEPNQEEVTLKEVLEKIENQNYKKVEIRDQFVQVFPKNEDDKIIYAGIANPSTFREQLSEIGIGPKTEDIYYKHPSGIDFFSVLGAISWTVIILIFIYAFMSTRNLTSGGPMMGFGDSKAKLFITPKKQNIKFNDIKGADEALEEVKEIVSFLKSPSKYIKMGARIPKGVLLIGPPGTGKTLLARAIAGEAGVPFFFTSGSEFEEMLVGTGASRVRDLFSKAKKASPAIIFIDEIDSIAKKRGMIVHSGNTEQTLNQILVEMDGFDKTTNVIIIAATNRPDVLDQALLRPGRFDRRVSLDLPDIKGREDILKLHSKNKPLAEEVKLEAVAKRTTGFSGADLENALNEAAIIAVQQGRKEIKMEDIEEAATKVTIGPAKKRTKSEKQKRLTAYHEAGHAVVGYYTAEADKVHRISIVSRGMTGGVTMYLPEEDENELKTNKKFEAMLIVLYGGRCAEEIVFDSITTGASSDIQRATYIARDMVKRYGMSSLGYIDYEKEDDYTTSNPYSEKTAEAIDKEIQKILELAREKSHEILVHNRNKLDRVAEILVEKEVIEGDEFYKIMEEQD